MRKNKRRRGEYKESEERSDKRRKGDNKRKEEGRRG